MKSQTYITTVHGFAISACLTRLDYGVNILLIGGSKTHIGAISVALPGERIRTIDLKHHKESVITEKWAMQICVAIDLPVCVECGIHYRDASKEQIADIVSACDKLQQEIIDDWRR